VELLTKTIAPYKKLPKEIYVIFICRIINSMGTFVFPLLSLILTQKIGFTKVQAGGFVSLLAIAQVPSMLIGGKLADSIGRKKIIIIFQTLGALCYIMCGLIGPSMSMAYIIVLASSLYAMARPAYDAVSADLTTPDNRRNSYSLLYMGWNIGFAIAPAVGGLLFKNHLPMLFIGDAVSTFISTVLFAVYIKETRKQKENMPEAVNVLEQHEEGSVFKVLFKRRILLYYALIMFIYEFTYAQWGFTLPLQMGDVFGSDGARLYGLVAGLNGIIVIVFTPLVTLCIKRVRPLKAIAFGGGLYALTFSLLCFKTHLAVYFAFIFIMTIGEVMISINNGTFIANHTPASHRGRINSILPIIIGIGPAIGPMIMGNFMEKHGHTVTWIVISAFILFGAACMMFLEMKERKADLQTSKINNCF
jgi:MFS family permease